MEDADVEIVGKAIDLVKIRSVLLYGDDTDLFVLALHHLRQIVLKNKFYMFRPMSSSYIDIECVSKSNSDSIIKNILPIHALSGCDTVSQVFGVGKTKLVKLVAKNPGLTDDLQIFSLPDQSEKRVLKAGLRILTSLYVGIQKKTTNYADLRSL